MSNTITQKDLENLVARINEATKSPETPWNHDDGKITANIGNYHLDYAYGGVKLERMCNEGGGVNTVSTAWVYGGYGTKRELYNWMKAFLSGMSIKS